MLSWKQMRSNKVMVFYVENHNAVQSATVTFTLQSSLADFRYYGINLVASVFGQVQQVLAIIGGLTPVRIIADTTRAWWAIITQSGRCMATKSYFWGSWYSKSVQLGFLRQLSELMGYIPL